jgi:transposase
VLTDATHLRKKKRTVFHNNQSFVRWLFLRTVPFLLPGFEVQHVVSVQTTLTITARAIKATAACPSCQHISAHIHSYYTRSPQDLPVIGHHVRLVLRVRRFRCRNPHCGRQTFVERLPDVIPVQAQKTTRLLTTLDKEAT